MNRYKVKFSDDSKSELRDIHAYISARSYASVATKVVKDIVAATKILSFSPHFAKVDDPKFAKMGYRKRHSGSYTIYFRIDETEKLVTIVTVMHGSRNWQEHLK